MIKSKSFLQSKIASFTIGAFYLLLFYFSKESRQDVTIPALIVWSVIFFFLSFISILSIAGPFYKKKFYWDEQSARRLASYFAGIVVAVIAIKIIGAKF